MPAMFNTTKPVKQTPDISWTSFSLVLQSIAAVIILLAIASFYQ
jgi:hypothetical protein